MIPRSNLGPNNLFNPLQKADRDFLEVTPLRIAEMRCFHQLQVIITIPCLGALLGLVISVQCNLAFTQVYLRTGG